MSELVLLREAPGVVRAKSTNPMDSTTVVRISRPYWRHTPPKSGVYLLHGEVDGRATIYVGMSTSDMRNRIAQHHVTPDKDWFGTLYAIPLNTSLVHGVEAEFIRIFSEAGALNVHNRSSEKRWSETGNLQVDAVVGALTPWLEILLGTEAVYGVEADVTASPSGSSARPAWNQDQWLAWVEKEGPPGTRAAMEEVIQIWIDRGRRLSFGNGATSAGLFPVFDHDGTGYWVFAVYARTVEVVFQWLARRPFTDSPEVRLQIANRLNEVPGIELSTDSLDRRPSFPIEVFLDPETRSQALEAEQWCADLVLRQSQ